MKRQENIRPSFNLTAAETYFLEMIRDSKYKDDSSMRVDFLKFKSRYMLKNVDKIEKMVTFSFLKPLGPKGMKKLCLDAERRI